MNRNGKCALSDTERTAIAEEFIELIDDVTGKVVRCRKFVAPPVNPEWPLYFTNAARERERRADAALPIVDWPGIRHHSFEWLTLCEGLGSPHKAAAYKH